MPIVIQKKVELLKIPIHLHNFANFVKNQSNMSKMVNPEDTNKVESHKQEQDESELIGMESSSSECDQSDMGRYFLKGNQVTLG